MKHIFLISEGYAAFENLDVGESGIELKGEIGSVKLNEGTAKVPISAEIIENWPCTGSRNVGGYAANLAPAELVGKLLNFFDSTAHRVVGGLPPLAPSSSQDAVHGNEQHYWPTSNSKSTMAMSSLVPSASMDPISDWTADNNRMTKPNRSVSEPDFEESGLVLRPRPGKQAKLGETNKFYYDEKLKRWIEEVVDPPAEEAALPPPPTTAAFQNAPTEYNLKSALKTEGSHSNERTDIITSTPEHSPGIPPIPPSSNQFSARSRLGVRSRYVDTFKQGGANLFQSSSVPSVKHALASNAKFFVPAPVPSDDHTMEAIAESSQEDSAASEDPSTSATNDWSHQSPLKNTMSTSMHGIVLPTW
ncbi:unnamed protein product [Lupinus luteus]|uniref:Uncharacterized protein n=1 Tax=Lupinus luteus TaxID=3873 RepID=A0AAV1WQU1_LUPLU